MIHEAVSANVISWEIPDSARHEFQAVVTSDEDGVSICALHYPGVISEGDSLDDAIRNIGEAFLLMLESRRDHGETMMYSDSPVSEVSAGSQVVRIVVDG